MSENSPKDWDGKVIDFEQVGYLPFRKDFIDEKIWNKEQRMLDKRKKILFLPGPLHEMSLQDLSDGSTDKRAYYVIAMFGILESGRRVTVIIENFRPYFAVRVPKADRDKAESFKEQLLLRLNENSKTKALSAEIKMLKRYIGYEEKPYPYVIITFAKTYNRKEAIKLCRTTLNYTTGYDDPTNYSHTFSRDTDISLTQWLELDNYNVVEDPNFKDEQVIKVSYTNVKTYDGKMDRTSLQRDKTLNAYWDLETYARDRSVPKPDKQGTCMFDLSLVFCWCNTSAPIMQYMITTRPCASRDGYVTILCENESQMILVMGKILEMMKPEILAGFNCGGYDWDWIINRAQRWNVISEFFDLCSSIRPYREQSVADLVKWNCGTETVKIEANLSAFERVVKIPGIQNMDVQNMFRQLFPTDGQWGLNYFLKKCNLQSKKDMTATQIFEAFEQMEKIQDHPLFEKMLKYEKKAKLRNPKEVYDYSVIRAQATQFENVNDDDDDTPEKKQTRKNKRKIAKEYEKMSAEDKQTELLKLYSEYSRVRTLLTDVAEYCIYDSYRCHELMLKRYVVTSKRQMAHISNTSLHCGIYRAGGCKARNSLIKLATQRGYAPSNIASTFKSKQKYPGAHVINPVPGARTTRLTPEERIRKNTLYKKDKEIHPERYENSSIPERQSIPYPEWEKVTPEQVSALRKFVAEHKEIVPVAMNELDATRVVKAVEIANDVGKMPNCFVKYLMEPEDRPISGLDYSSLYPSIDMTYNLSPEMMITPDTCDGGLQEALQISKKLTAQGEDLHRIEFQYGDRPVLAWCVRHQNKPEKMGILPTVYVKLMALRDKYKVPVKLYKFILEYVAFFKYKGLSIHQLITVIMSRFGDGGKDKDMLDPRKILETLELYPSEDEIKSIETRLSRFKFPTDQERKIFLGIDKKGEHKIEIESDRTDTILTIDDIDFYYNYFNLRQLAVKVFMNTFYGESGNQLSALYMKELAGAITSGGKRNLMFAHDVVSKEGCGIKYGDSVSADTPILCRLDGKTFYRTIDNLPRSKKWKKDNITGKKIAKPVKDLEVWSDTGFTKIKRIIKHKTDKQMYRVLTHTGCVIVTKDHSLLTPEGEEIPPTDIDIGDELMHNDLPDIDDNKTNNYNVKCPFAMGLFYADGSCGKYYCGDSTKYSWAINKQDLSLLNKAKADLELAYPDITFKILDCMESSKVYKLVPTGQLKDIVLEWRDLFYDKRKYKIVPDIILSAKLSDRQKFFEGYYAGDGDKTDAFRADNKGQIGAAGLYYLINSLGYNVALNTRLDKMDIYRLNISKVGKYRLNSDAIKKIEKLDIKKCTVYDLETENHHFGAGIGRMIVHNTDSLYITGPERAFTDVDRKYFCAQMTKLEYWTEIVKITFTEITRVNKIVNDALKADNGTNYLKMAYEEVIFPYLLQRKKKYAGVKHEELINFFIKALKELFLKGIDANRRGVSILSVRATERIMLGIFDINNLWTLRELVLQEIDTIYEDFKAGKLKIEDFIKSAKYQPISAEDRLAGKGNKSMLTFADRMAARGTPLIPYTRVSYIIARKYPSKYDYKGRKKALSTGERMETVEYFTANGLEIDIDYYMVNYVCGQLAPFISYHPDFYDEPKDESAKEIKRAGDSSNKSARKFLSEYTKKYTKKYVDRGPLMRTFSKYTLNSIKKAYDKIGETSVYKLLNYDWQVGTVSKFQASVIKITDKLCDKKSDETDRAATAKKFVRSAIKRHKSDYLYTLYREYVTKTNSKRQVAKNEYEQMRAKCMSKLTLRINTVMSTIHKHIAIIEQLTNQLRSMCGAEVYINNPDLQITGNTVEEVLRHSFPDLGETEIEDMLEKYEDNVREIITSFTNESYHRRGIRALTKATNNIISAKNKLLDVEAMATYIDKKVKRDNGQNEPDPDEIKDFVETMTEAINNGETFQFDSDDESMIDGKKSKTKSKIKDEYKPAHAVIDADEDDDQSDHGEWIHDEDDVVIINNDDDDDDNVALPIDDNEPDNYLTAYDI